MKSYLTLLCFCIINALFAQPVLKPSIGLSALPNDTDAVCTIPVYNDPSGDFTASGFFVNDTIPHFRLFDKNGISYDISQILSQNKPVLLVTGNITCPVFRAYIDSINTYQSLYGNDITIFVVYVVEAHPQGPDVSPYSGNVWVTQQNIYQNYLYYQPDTYKERKDLVDSLMVRKPVNVPVLIDGPCNAWWSAFGPAPNNAYLIKPDGIVAVKNGWFINPPHSWRNDIDSVLNVVSVDQNKTEENSWSVFPNPADETISVFLKDMGAKARIYDHSYRLVYTNDKMEQGVNKINLTNFEQGIYIIQINTDKGNSYKRVHVK